MILNASGDKSTGKKKRKGRPFKNVGILVDIASILEDLQTQKDRKMLSG